MSIKWAEVYFQPVKTFILFNVGDIFMGSKAEHLVTLIVMGSKAEHLVTLIVVSKGGDAGAGYYCYGHAARTNNRNGA